MKTPNEIIESLANTFKVTGCPLSSDQIIVLTGSLHIWIDKIKSDQDEITKSKHLTSLYKIQKDHSYDKDGILIPFDKVFSAIMNTKAV